MKNFIICGTSGVGKTFLEEVLEKEHGFYQLVKHMDRNPRPGEENNPKVKFLTEQEFDEMKKDFAFTLEYAGHRYGWTKSDIELHNFTSVTLGVTLESLKEIFKSLPEFIPVLLHIDGSNLELIEKRIKDREGYDKLSAEAKIEIDKKIKERIELAKKEIESIEQYEKIVNENNGKVFLIKDDSTIFTEVIPWILSKHS